MDFEKLIYVVVGAIIGFTLSLAKDWLMESKKQKEKEKQFKREKLERAFMILEDFNNKVTSIEPISLREGEYNSNELNMIIRFYFDDIYKEYSTYLNIAILCLNNVKIKKLGDNELQNYYKEYKKIVTLLVNENKKISI
jgi:hypothetical protein